MKERIKLLSLVVGNTVTLLAIAALLIVVGIFNESLDWDIFGPKAEAVLYGLFGSCIALSVVGVAMTIVLGVQEIAKSFRALEHDRLPADRQPLPEAARAKYAEFTIYAAVCVAALIGMLAVVNHRIQIHRAGVCKKIAAEQLDHFAPKIALLLAPLASPPQDNVPRDLHDLINTLNSLSFISSATLYIPDPKDRSAMWGYTAWRAYNKKDGFAKFYIAKEFEKAMRMALDGDEAELEKINRKTGFDYYHVIRSDESTPIGVIRLIGNSSENFREYSLGS